MSFREAHVCVFIHSPVRVGTLLMGVPWTPTGASFFEFELKSTGKDSADPTQHEFQHYRRNPSLNTGLEWSANHCATLSTSEQQKRFEEKSNN